MPYLSWKSFDWQYDAFSLFDSLKDRKNIFFLDSSLAGGALGTWSSLATGRYSFLGFEPFLIFKEKANANSLGRLRELLKPYKLADTGRPSIPFPGGAVGYCSYDLGLYLEEIAHPPARWRAGRSKDDLGLPDIFFAFYDSIIAVDHWMRKLYIFSSGFPEKATHLAKKKAEERLKQVISSLSRLRRGRRAATGSQPVCVVPTANLTKAGYLAAVAKAKDYISQGDIYQVNLSQRFSARLKTEAADLYKRLRRASPSNFSAFFDCGDFQIISSSPERFLKYAEGKVSTRPMKGTRPRSQNEKDDLRHKQDLLASAKDKAELLMIVDLLRNDLGRVCEYGSIKVSSQRSLEAYTTVYQTTATIEGRLHRDKDRIDLLKACFPGGSITGCPKIRSMQIIEELEPTRRSIYTGSLGYLGFNGTMDLNILIRTILKKDDKIYFQVGGGIVADSKPESEYQETLVKAEGMFRALGNELRPLLKGAGI